jgi:hypothetical protein
MKHSPSMAGAGARRYDFYIVPAKRLVEKVYFGGASRDRPVHLKTDKLLMRCKPENAPECPTASSPSEVDFSKQQRQAATKFAKNI